MKWNWKKISQSGFTLTELLASLAITGIVFAAATVALVTFFSKYEQLNKYVDFQSAAYDCLQKDIKYGVAIGNSQNKEWYGIANCDSFKVEGTEVGQGATSIYLFTPRISAESQHDYVRYELRGDKIMASYKHGNYQTSSPVQIFPKPSRLKQIIWVKELRFKPLKINSADAKARVVQVTMVAKCEVGKNVYWRGRTLHKDPIYKYVHYTTKMVSGIK